MRIGKQGIPLWFRCFENKDDHNAFEESLLTEGISYVSSLFPKDFDLIFLADRWFNSTSLMSHIDSLGHTYCIRLKKNIKALIYNEKEGHDVWCFLDKAKHYVHHANYFHNIKLTENLYKCNLVIGPSKTKRNNYYTEPWIIVTNGDPKRALKDYAYRFGSIECIFKNQKFNGFYLENTCNASLKYFQSLYTFVCISTLFLTILGTVFAKNDRPHKHVTITTHNKKSGPGKRRVLSLFNTGLTLFKRAYNSSTYIYIPFNFVLHDV